MTSVIDSFSLSDGAPSSARTSTHAEVTAHRLRDANVVWLNRKWFLRKGVDVLDREVRRGLCLRLLDEFGYCVRSSPESTENTTNEAKVFFADRYGGSGLEIHGGSGRAASRLGVQVKGIGPTPLVGQVADPGYLHGCAWLEEAVREAIYAELLDAETPYGAVPVIAVLDCGFSSAVREGSQTEPRALILRPEVTRVAHLQRATLFREHADPERFSAGSDVLRVRAAFADFAGAGGAGDDLSPADALTEILDRMIVQSLASRVIRLFSGGPFTSNFALDGAFIDFGSFTATLDWSKLTTTPHTPSLGAEGPVLKDAWRSMLLHARKFAPAPLSDASVADMANRFDILFHQRENESWLQIFGPLAGRASGVGPVLSAYFAAQQRNHVSHSRGARSAQSWLYEEMPALGVRPAQLSVAAKIVAALEEDGGPGRDRPSIEAMLASARRTLKPRPVVDRELLQADIYALIAAAHTTEQLATSIEAFISDRLHLARRVWPDLPGGLVLLAQRSDEISTLARCLDTRSRRARFLVRTLTEQDNMILFGRRYAASSLISSVGAASAQTHDCWFDLDHPDFPVEAAQYCLSTDQPWQVFEADCVGVSG